MVLEHKITYWQAHGCNLIRLDPAREQPLSLEKIFHDEISIIAFSDSIWKSEQNGKSYIETPNCVVIRDAGQVYSVKAEQISAGAICRELRVLPSRLREIYEEAELPVPEIDFSNPVINNPKLYRLMMKTHKTLENNYCALESSSLITVLFCEIAKIYGQKDSGKSKLIQKCIIRDVIEYLRANYPKQITLKELSALTKVNPFVLLRQFKKEIGMTPHEYLQTHRISCARKFIREGFSLTEVSQMCGFSDQSHLTRLFKRKVGVTPGQFSPLGK